MPYFIRTAGRRGESPDDGGDRLLVYWLRVRGTTVIAVWGRGEVLRERQVRYYWCRKLGEKIHACETADLARKLMKSLAAALLGPRKGYRPLGYKVHILPPRRPRKEWTGRQVRRVEPSVAPDAAARQDDTRDGPAES